jgi:hypothetical protein
MDDKNSKTSDVLTDAESSYRGMLPSHAYAEDYLY